MNASKTTTKTVTTLALLGLSACGFSSGGTPSNPAIERVDQLMTWVEHVHTESELAKQKVQAASDLIAALTGGNIKGDTHAAFGQYQAAVEDSARQADRLHETIRALQAAAQPVFDQWNIDILQISNLQMRRRSQGRYDETSQRYQTLLTAAKSAANGHDNFNQQARDLATFLRNDLNAAALSEIRDDVRGMGDLALELDGRFNRCLASARDYLGATAVQSVDPPADPRPAAPARDPGVGATPRR